LQARRFHGHWATASIRCRDWRRFSYGRGLAVLGHEGHDAYAQDHCKDANCQQCTFDKFFHGYTSFCVFDSFHFMQTAVKMR
jgi:hypothetical protein